MIDALQKKGKSVCADMPHRVNGLEPFGACRVIMRVAVQPIAERFALVTRPALLRPKESRDNYHRGSEPESCQQEPPARFHASDYATASHHPSNTKPSRRRREEVPNLKRKAVGGQ